MLHNRYSSRSKSLIFRSSHLSYLITLVDKIIFLILKDPEWPYAASIKDWNGGRSSGDRDFSNIWNSDSLVIDFSNSDSLVIEIFQYLKLRLSGDRLFKLRLSGDRDFSIFETPLLGDRLFQTPTLWRRKLAGVWKSPDKKNIRQWKTLKFRTKLILKKVVCVM